MIIVYPYLQLKHDESAKFYDSYLDISIGFKNNAKLLLVDGSIADITRLWDATEYIFKDIW